MSGWYEGGSEKSYALAYTRRLPLGCLASRGYPTAYMLSLWTTCAAVVHHIHFHISKAEAFTPINFPRSHGRAACFSSFVPISFLMYLL